MKVPAKPDPDSPSDSNPDVELESLLRDAASNPQPAAWARTVAHGLEARVLQRLAATRRPSWLETLLSLASWRPIAAAAGVVVLLGVWSGRATADLFDDSWLAAHVEADDAGTDELEDVEF